MRTKTERRTETLRTKIFTKLDLKLLGHPTAQAYNSDCQMRIFVSFGGF